MEESKRNLMSAVTTSASKTVADRKKFCEDTYRLVKKMETDIRKELRENYEKWLFMLPLQPAGPTQTDESRRRGPSDASRCKATDTKGGRGAQAKDPAHSEHVKTRHDQLGTIDEELL